MCWKTKEMAVQSASLSPDESNWIPLSHEHSFFKKVTSWYSNKLFTSKSCFLSPAFFKCLNISFRNDVTDVCSGCTFADGDNRPAMNWKTTSHLESSTAEETNASNCSSVSFLTTYRAARNSCTVKCRKMNWGPHSISTVSILCISWIMPHDVNSLKPSKASSSKTSRLSLIPSYATFDSRSIFSSKAASPNLPCVLTLIDSPLDW